MWWNSESPRNPLPCHGGAVRRTGPRPPVNSPEVRPGLAAARIRKNASRTRKQVEQASKSKRHDVARTLCTSKKISRGPTSLSCTYTSLVLLSTIPMRRGCGVCRTKITDYDIIWTCATGEVDLRACVRPNQPHPNVNTKRKVQYKMWLKMARGDPVSVTGQQVHDNMTPSSCGILAFSTALGDFGYHRYSSYFPFPPSSPSFLELEVLFGEGNSKAARCRMQLAAGCCWSFPVDTKSHAPLLEPWKSAEMLSYPNVLARITGTEGYHGITFVLG
ncbi:hypothetical protein BDP81DRAFT_448547 [Colletotrichum phormii]|uniref:Uncharacterized protein n=1 Tax=Colletotrichum phormii TaxID=359342 RepID=A0AAI9ZVD4_9PEZI|nr:uncharacterized protein BDP81DRAFT_448547 [Colletotrichum phormii]KAK1638520.1 hypothetical protein BDP81DRAFT_448547 [Colletotrichum phormii]